MSSSLYTLPASLPISAYAETLIETMRSHQVVIVCGDTGSGKTTQLPKLVAMAHPEAKGWIGITQPRRLAALAMARRLADELQTPIGSKVGYQHRFERKLSPATRFKFMTDGILLAETREDPLFRRYSTIIVDEAHERSLNIDFLLGILKQVLSKRPDLRVIISSATLDAERFSTFFNQAPVVSIPGRLYPIETVWMPEEDAEEDDLPRRVANAVDMLGPDSGDILVFLPGERDIRETMAFLESRRLPRTECLPLLASLPAGEQARVFQASDKRRIVLATNVAETSVTIPGIRAVIDSGVARIKRYSAQRHVQTLRIEPISQASARQRMGRCGRVGPGICIRLYSEEDYLRREPHTAPEIKRSALAGVILTMADLRLGRIEDFPFLEPPAGTAIREGYRELLELGALQRNVRTREGGKEEHSWRLTGIGRALATFPLEPRFARMLLAAEAEQSLADALTVVAAMACDEPLLRPFEKSAQADQQHARFKSTVSDFNARLKLWAWWNDASQGTSETQRRKRCKATFISYPKMREWANIRAQLEDLCKSRSLHVQSTQGGEVGLHRALLSGLLSRIGHFDREAREYRGAFGVRFVLFPGSGLAKEKREKPSSTHVPPKKPRPDELPTSKEWVLAGELVETSRLFARHVACIDPRWIEPIAGPLCKVHRHSAFWDGERGFVRVHEDVTLFGLLLASGRLRDLSHLDPPAARRFFIADALCEPDALRHAPAWLQANWQRQRLLDQLLALRRNERDSLREALISFYEAHLPAEVCNAHTLRKRCPPLPLKGKAFEVDDATSRDFPVEMTIGGERFPVVYVHDPQAVDDGVTLIATPANVHLLAHWHGEWLVPGLLPEKIMWLLNALPSRTRHVLGSLLEVQSLILSRVTPYRRPLVESLYQCLRDEKAVRVDETPWAEERLPNHLRMNYRVVDGETVLGQGRNLDLLIELFADKKTAPAPKAATIADPALARLANRKECLEALRAKGGSQWNAYGQFPSLTPAVKAFLKTAEIDVGRMGQEMLYRAIEMTFLKNPDDPKTTEELNARYSACKQQLPSTANGLRRHLIYILTETARLEHLATTLTGIYPETTEDVLDQLAWLVYDGFVAATPSLWLDRYPLILQAIADRLERARNNPAGDRKKLAMLQGAWQRYTDFVVLTKKPRHDARKLNDYRWAIESLRMGLFNPTLQPFERTSEKKLEALWQEMLQA
ncbi:MAG: ATP-dependent RNA helicase HrpA [bacterium]|nr:ATP-dependent RNA helicase HrpA [bacterium]